MLIIFKFFKENREAECRKLKKNFHNFTLFTGVFVDNKDYILLTFLPCLNQLLCWCVLNRVSS